jgi:hypothetical protein
MTDIQYKCLTISVAIFAILIYNIRMRRRNSLIQKLQSATAYVETIQELYQSKGSPLEIVPLLQAVAGMLQEIRREVLLQELTSVMHNEDLPAAKRKEKVEKIFKLSA